MVNARAVNSLRGKVIAMLSLLGLLGALFATLSADVLLPADRTEPEEDAEPSDADSENGTDMLMLLGESSTEEAQSDDDPAGMPLSDDVPDAVDDNVTLIGDEAANRLDGLGGDDLVLGGAGDDLLGGRGGDDSLLGEDGNDHLDGGEGNDLLSGGDNNDALDAGAGDDTLFGGAGWDTLSGHEGNDQLSGGDGSDLLLGGEGADQLTGQAGDDTLDGGYGNDLLSGGLGSDELNGGPGQDTIWGQWPGETDLEGDILNGGAGDDLLMLGSGDIANGGEAADVFALQDIHSGDPLAQIMDYDPSQDQLVILYDANLHPDPLLSIDSHDGSCTLLIDGVPLADLAGHSNIDIGTVQLRAA